MSQILSQAFGCVLLFSASVYAYYIEKRLKEFRPGIMLAIYACATVAILLIAGFANVALSTIHGMLGDNIYVYNVAKNYINGFGSRLNPSLGFPGTLDMAYFPSFDFLFRVFLQLSSLFTEDPVVSYNLMYFAGVAAMTGVTFVSMRALLIPAWLSILGAAVYVISPYFVFRSLGHDYLSLYISAPMGATLAILIGTMPPNQSADKFFRRPFVWAAIPIIATSGLYYAFFSCMFILLVGVCAAVGRQRLTLLVPGLVLPAIIFPMLVVTGYGSALIDVLQGKIAQVPRSAFEELIYGLSLVEASHVFADIRFTEWVYNTYLAVMPLLFGANGQFEWPGMMLTSVILLSPVLAFASGLRHSHQSRTIFICAACLCFGVFYAQRGGLGYFFSLLITPQIRAPARIMPFLTFFAVVIVISAIFFCADRKWGRLGVASGTALLVALLISAIPNVGAFGRKAQTYAGMPVLQAKYVSTKAILSVKDRAGVTVVLQLPHMAWPEVVPKLKFDAYDHQLPFVFDRPKSLTRWSYGSNLNQESFKQVANLVAQHRTDGLADAAIAFGFDAILIEKAGYSGPELAELQAAIASPTSCIAHEDSMRLFYLLGKTCDKIAQ